MGLGKPPETGVPYHVSRVSWSRNLPVAVKKSRHSLDGEIIKLGKGVAIYKTHASPSWNARIRDPKVRKYVVIRGVTVTNELYDLILFVTHSFVRPTTTELYSINSIRHSDVEIADKPKRLHVTIRDGKTGFRVANTMPGAVSVYQRIQKRHPDAEREDFIFLPHYKNRATASRIIQRQFNAALERADIKHDPFTDTDHTVYSLRHTAICIADRVVRGTSEHLRSSKECWHLCRPDRALLCTAPATVSGIGEQPAEFWWRSIKKPPKTPFAYPSSILNRSVTNLDPSGQGPTDHNYRRSFLYRASPSLKIQPLYLDS